ncbi:MAG: hypothetical protein JKX98_11455 [Alcanivoracaceae bacterium]|nr:hypothetical protein [Alcanivoracaceae bacterium]
MVWRQTHEPKVLNVVNPQSFREFILDYFEDSRIPIWMLNVEIPIAEEGSLSLSWILTPPTINLQKVILAMK